MSMLSGVKLFIIDSCMIIWLGEILSSAIKGAVVDYNLNVDHKQGINLITKMICHGVFSMPIKEREERERKRKKLMVK